MDAKLVLPHSLEIRLPVLSNPLIGFYFITYRQKDAGNKKLFWALLQTSLLVSLSDLLLGFVSVCFDAIYSPIKRRDGAYFDMNDVEKRQLWHEGRGREEICPIGWQCVHRVTLSHQFGSDTLTCTPDNSGITIFMGSLNIYNWLLLISLVASCFFVNSRPVCVVIRHHGGHLSSTGHLTYNKPSPISSSK